MFNGGNIPTCKPQVDLTKNAINCMNKPNISNCVVKPAIKVITDPCMQSHVIHQGMQDPYVQHMPNNNLSNAVLYSAKMGGEHHEISQCEIM